MPALEEPVKIPKGVTVAAICDVLDSLGFRSQAMHQRIRPLDPDHATFVGRARTVRWMECDYIVTEDPYGLEIDMMDSLKPGDVVIHSADYGGTNAPWGELMSTMAQVRARSAASVTARSETACGSRPWASRCSTRASGP